MRGAARESQGDEESVTEEWGWSGRTDSRRQDQNGKGGEILGFCNLYCL